MMTFVNVLGALVACFVLLTIYAGFMSWVDKKFPDTRTVKSFEPKMFLCSLMPNYGNYQPVEGWLVELSDGSKIPARKFYNSGLGKIEIYNPVIGAKLPYSSVSMLGHTG